MVKTLPLSLTYFPCMMRTTSTRIQLEKSAKDSSVAAPSRQGASYPRQTAAHLYFIFGGMWLSLSWYLRRLIGRLPTDVAAERLMMHQKFSCYISLLERWNLVEISFSGFEDSSSWQGSVIAPNHPSILDAILLMTRLPGLDCVMNARLLRDPVMTGVARLCNFVRNDTPFSMVRDSRERLAKGSNVLIFPEGTRSNATPVGVFHHGYALAAARAKAPIRTVFIECDSDYFGRNFSYFRPARCPVRYHLSAGRVFFPGPKDDPRTISGEIESYFRENLRPNRQEAPRPQT